MTTEHQYQNAYHRLRRWLLDKHPQIYEEYSRYHPKGLAGLVEVDHDLKPVKEITR